MKFTLSWLKEHLETDANIETIAETLTQIGLEVEDITDPSKDLSPYIVGHVEACEPHPDADKLQVLQVNIGEEVLQVVCGASNAKLGLKGAFAGAGTYVKGIDLTLKKVKIRGVESNGMLCSERELELSDEHNGIIELPEDAEIGAAIAPIMGLDDPIIEVDLTPNRSDCAGIRGIARDLAAAGLGKLKPLEISAVKGSFKSPISVKIDMGEGREDACPLFIGRSIKNVTNGESPKWLQDRLTSIGLRPISALVDISNYFTITYGRPLHCYDEETLAGGIIVRPSKKGEKLEALDDGNYELDDGMIAICDEDGILGLGGVVGGVASGCTFETVDVFLETAIFDPIEIAKTGQKLNIISDARYRFERGIDPEFAFTGMEMATRMILDLCGGETSEPVIVGKVPEWQRDIILASDRVQHLCGVEIAHDEQLKILRDLGCVVEEITEGFKVNPPSWRPDIHGSADLVEEIIRIYGYDKIPLILPERTHLTSPSVTPMQNRSSKARRLLAMRGMDESVTWSFTDKKSAALFGEIKEELELLNPISTDLSVMRSSVLTTLLQAVKRNADRGYADIALFEVGPQWRNADIDGQDRMASGLRVGKISARHWNKTQEDVSIYDVKADAEAVLAEIGAPVANLQIRRDAPEYYHPGRSGSFCLGKNVLGYFGELHPAVLADMGVKTAVCGFEVFLDAAPQKKKKTTARAAADISSLQALYRDFAFVVKADVPADKLIRAAKGVDKKLITEVSLFDIYEGKGVEEGHKSLALQVTLQPRDKTLTDAEIEALAAKITANVEKQTGGVLRG